VQDQRKAVVIGAFFRRCATDVVEHGAVSISSRSACPSGAAERACRRAGCRAEYRLRVGLSQLISSRDAQDSAPAGSGICGATPLDQAGDGEIFNEDSLANGGAQR